jgi:predicted RNA-binding protein with EMAP domain
MPIDMAGSLQIIHEIRSLILRIKYMYLPAKLLAKTREIENLRILSIRLSRKLLDKNLLREFKPDRLLIAEIHYALRIIYGLKQRLLLGDENNPLYAIDIEGVEIVSVARHPEARKLFITKAEGQLPYDIITNIQNPKSTRWIYSCNSSYFF